MEQYIVADPRFDGAVYVKIVNTAKAPLFAINFFIRRSNWYIGSYILVGSGLALGLHGRTLDAHGLDMKSMGDGNLSPSGGPYARVPTRTIKK